MTPRFLPGIPGSIRGRGCSTALPYPGGTTKSPDERLCASLTAHRIHDLPDQGWQGWLCPAGVFGPGG
jgi:hypothetical protein